MAIALGDNIKLSLGLPNDARYFSTTTNKPWTSCSDVNSTLAGGVGGVRYTGLTVNIAGTEWWYKEGILDTCLIEKESGGGTLNMSGDTVGGLTTYVDGTTICAWSGLTYSGGSLYQTGNMILQSIGDPQLRFLRDCNNNVGLCAQGLISYDKDSCGFEFRVNDEATPRLFLGDSGQTAIKSCNAIYSGHPSLRIYDQNNRGTMLLESVTDNPTDFFMKVGGNLTWGISARQSASDHALDFYPSTNGTSWGSLALKMTTGGTICAPTCLKTAAITITTGAASGCVLQSDGSGNATWETPSGGGGIAMSGSTVGGLTTYVDADTICAESNLKWNGTTLSVLAPSSIIEFSDGDGIIRNIDTLLKLDGNDGVELQYTTATKLATTSVGINVCGNIIIPATGTAKEICVLASTTPSNLNIGAGCSTDTSAGGFLYLRAGSATASGAYGGVTYLCAGCGDDFGGPVFICAGCSVTSYGGDVTIRSGTGPSGTGAICLCHGTILRLNTTTSGIAVTGTQTITGSITSTSGLNKPIVMPAGGYYSSKDCAGVTNRMMGMGSTEDKMTFGSIENTAACVIMHIGGGDKHVFLANGTSTFGGATCATIFCGTSCLRGNFVYSTGMVCAAGTVCGVTRVQTPIVCASTCLSVNPTDVAHVAGVTAQIESSGACDALRIYGDCNQSGANVALRVYNKGGTTSGGNCAIIGDAYHSIGSSTSGRSHGIWGFAGNKTDKYNFGVIGMLCGTQEGAGIYGSVGAYSATPTGLWAGVFKGPVYNTSTVCAATCMRSPVHCATTAFRSTGTGYRYCGGTGCGTAVDWVATSDCRIKDCITPISNALSIVDALCGVCYELCEDGTLDMGLIAQEVLCVEPRLVSKGEPIEEYKKYGVDDELLSLKYDKMAGLFVEAIKELKTQNECLQLQINELRSKE